MKLMFLLLNFWLII